jgi:putative transposase
MGLEVRAPIQPDRETAGQVWRHVADQLRPRFEKRGRLMDDGEHDVLAYMTFAAQHRTKLAFDESAGAAE